MVAPRMTEPLSGLFRDGRWERSAAGASTIAVENPATGMVLASVVAVTPDDALAAAGSATAALPLWRAVPATERAAVLDAVADELGRRATPLAKTIVEENGKTLKEAADEVEWAQSFFRTYAEEARRMTNRLLARVSGKQPIVQLAPYGVILAVTPWNDPLGMIARQIAPALAAGCTVVWKPASLTPLTALAFADAVTAAGLPAGVLNVFVTRNSEASIDQVLASRHVDKLVFTGSTSTGLQLAGRAAARGIPSNLELGGNAAFIVLDDADLELAADGVVLRKFVQAGQGCTCVNRLFAERKIADRLLDLILARVATISIGEGIDPDTTMGPLIRKDEIERLDGLVAEATSAGAKVLWRGESPNTPRLRGGAFFPPHVLTDVEDGMRVAHEEIFGPVLPVLRFDDDDEVIDRANAVEHGLAAYVYGDETRALDVANRLEVGLVGVNDASPQAPYYPVGGIKASGWGVAGGVEGLMEYVTYRSISFVRGRGATLGV